MKALLCAACLCAAATAAEAQYQRPYQANPYTQQRSYENVRPYVNRQGEFYQGHRRSAPDGNPYNNWSSRGNTNPFTGQRGYRNPYPF